jgi:hypothetical protein
VRALHLDPRRPLDVARDQPAQRPTLGETLEQGLGALHHPVAVGVGHLGGQVAHVGHDDLPELGLGRRSAQHAGERLARDVGVGLPALAIALDVGVHAEALPERARPRPRAGPTGAQQGAVDVEQDDGRCFGHPTKGRTFDGERRDCP